MQADTRTIPDLSDDIPTPGRPGPGPWKCGDEWLPFHPSASHVPPEYRDGWNRAYYAARSTVRAPVDAAAQEAAPQQGQWRPIETAPKDGTLVLLGARNGVWVGKHVPVYQSGYRPENPWSSMLLNHDHMAERYTRPTHWMPLPHPPASLQQHEQQEGA